VVFCDNNCAIIARNYAELRDFHFTIAGNQRLACLNKDDERIKEFHEEEKDFNLITFIGDKALDLPSHMLPEYRFLQ